MFTAHRRSNSSVLVPEREGRNWAGLICLPLLITGLSGWVFSIGARNLDHCLEQLGQCYPFYNVWWISDWHIPLFTFSRSSIRGEGPGAQCLCASGASSSSGIVSQDSYCIVSALTSAKGVCELSALIVNGCCLLLRGGIEPEECIKVENNQAGCFLSSPVGILRKRELICCTQFCMLVSKRKVVYITKCPLVGCSSPLSLTLRFLARYSLQPSMIAGECCKEL